MRSRRLLVPFAASCLLLSCSTLPQAPRERITVTGTITDRDGTPLEGVLLYFRPYFPDYGSYSRQAVTAENGTYTVALASGRHSVRLQWAGSLPRVVETTISREHRRFDYAFQGFRVSGTLLGPDRTLLPAGGIWVLGARGGEYVEVQDSTFSFLVLPGCYSMSFQAATFTMGIPIVTLPQICVTRDTTLHVNLDGHIVSGTVTGPGGASIGRVTITAYMADGTPVNYTETQSAGTYSLRLPTGNYTFVARPVVATFIAPRWLGLTTIDAPRTLDWDFTGTEWTGTVRLAATLEPLPSAYVSATQAGAYTYAYTNADANGAFRLIVQPGIVFTVQAYGSDAYVRVPGIAAGSDSTLDLLLSPGYPYTDAGRRPAAKGDSHVP